MTRSDERGCNIQACFETYHQGGMAIQIYDDEEYGVMMPYATATTWVDGLAQDEVSIDRTGLGSEGIYELLIGLGVIHEAHRMGYSGFSSFSITRVNWKEVKKRYHQ